MREPTIALLSAILDRHPTDAVAPVVQALDGFLRIAQHAKPEELVDASGRLVVGLELGSDERWQQGLPDELVDIIVDAAMQMDDTYSAPEIARNFESTPDQLGARLRALIARTGT